MGASASDPAPSRLQAELRPLAKRKLKYVSCTCPSHVPHQLSRLPITPEKLSSSFRAADRSMVRPRSSEGPTCADTLPDSDRKPPSSLAESSSSVAPVSALHVTGRGHAHRRLVSFNGAGAGWPRKTARSSTGQGRWLAGQVARGVATPAGGTPQTYSTNIQFQRLFHFQRT